MNLNNSLILDIIYPIGSYYWNNSLIDIDNVIGGHWERVKDKFVLAVGDTYTTSGATGGEATHTLTVSEMPQHRHRVSSTYSTSGSATTSSTDAQAVNNYLEAPNVYTEVEGGSQPHNNMPPYITAYCWKRIS